MLEGPGKKPPTTFPQLRESYGPRPSGSGEAKQVRLTSLAGQEGANLVRQAMENEYPRHVVEAVRRKVHDTTGRRLDEGMTRGDLNLLHEELQYQGLQKLNQELQELRSRVPSDTPEAIRDDLAQVWRSPSDITRGSQWPTDDPQRLLSRISLNYLQYAEMKFDEAAGTLRLTPRVGVDPKLLEANMVALAGFIRKNFEVEPDRLAFRYIASNILSYLHQGKPASMLDKMQAVAGNAAHPDANAVRSMFTFSVREDGNVSVVGDTDIPFKTRGDGDVGRVDFSKLSFARHEEFEISAEHLTSAPTVFNAKANLVSVNRFDTIDLGRSPALQKP